MGSHWRGLSFRATAGQRARSSSCKSEEKSGFDGFDMRFYNDFFHEKSQVTFVKEFLDKFDKFLGWTMLEIIAKGVISLQKTMPRSGINRWKCG